MYLSSAKLVDDSFSNIKIIAKNEMVIIIYRNNSFDRNDVSERE